MRPAPAGDADRAILRTITYAALFGSPLTLSRLHRGLMDVALDPDELRERLAGAFLASRIAVTDGLVHPRGREDWVAVRDERRRHTDALLARHRRLLDLLVAFPFVRLVALSGACAHENATDDDVDVFLVVRRGRAWSVCLALMVLCKAAGARRTLCLNYVVDETAMALPEQDLFTAAEIVGMKPLAGRDAYRRFVEGNGWIASRFPNFFAAYREESRGVPEIRLPRRLEGLLDLGGASLFESVARRVLGAWLRRRVGSAPGVVLARDRLKLHTRDHRPRLHARFAEALRHAGGL